MVPCSAPSNEGARPPPSSGLTIHPLWKSFRKCDPRAVTTKPKDQTVTDLQPAIRAIPASVVTVHDPVERLSKIRELEDEVDGAAETLRYLKRETILELRRADPPLTWARIGELLGVGKSRAEQLSRT